MTAPTALPSGPPRWRLRPTELATLASALLLLATAVLVPDGEERRGLLVTVALTTAYALVWNHLLPPGAFGEARYAVGGSVMQVILVYMLVTTGGAGSPWFVFYVLPVLATVFSYRPRATAAIAIVAVAGLVAVPFLAPADRADDASLELLVVLLVGLGAVSSMAYMITRTMRDQRDRRLDQEERLREALAATERDALTDPLTGAHNRRSLDRFLAAVTSRAARDQRPYSLLLVDVDGLKALNDRAGHTTGDRALRLVARAAAEVVRAYDLVARLGGDEFVVVLHETPHEAARHTAERIRERAAYLFGLDPAMEGMSVSVGTAAWRPEATPSEVLAEADADMYGAKRDRRGLRRLRVAGED